MAVLGFLAAGLFMIWIEVGIWRTIRRFGRYSDVLVLLGIHVALGARHRRGRAHADLRHHAHDAGPTSKPTWRDGVVYGARLSATYMGYVVFLRVLLAFCGELFAVRSRRLFAIARLSIFEANRRMWAPWVVIMVFGLILAFTHWFLQPPRAAEMGRLFVGTLTLLCSLLLTVDGHDPHPAQPAARTSSTRRSTPSSPSRCAGSS